MSEKPILMSADSMDRTLHKGKAATSRVVVPQPVVRDGRAIWKPKGVDRILLFVWCAEGPIHAGVHKHAPNQVGDILWMREAWRVHYTLDCFPPRDIVSGQRVAYEADGPCGMDVGKYRPGMFMPKWASRMRRLVTGVTMRRLSDMTEADARLEGCESLAEYKVIWDGLNAERGFGWTVNPFVWFYEYSREEAGMQQFPKGDPPEPVEEGGGDV